MNVEIRRNRTLTLGGEMKVDGEAIQQLMGQMPKPTKEQEKIMEHSQQMLHGIKEKIWAYIDEHPTLDLLGQPISRDTHLIDFDTEVVEKDGAQWIAPKTFYIMPIKSEYEK
ncbi:MAG: hypothetical protein IJ551_09695 [Prevotella sp.]|nr:hypothetical protein [Prevotella sp.]